jgi:outer membrane protein assembly factor BamD (BamD/ComL family)
MFRPFRCTILGFALLCLAQSSINNPAMLGTNSTVAPATLPNSSLLGEANGFYRKGDFGKAITKYKAVTQDKPTSPEVGWFDSVITQGEQCWGCC